MPSRHPDEVAFAMISHFFIDRPIFATVLSIVITLTGGDRAVEPADRPVPADHAARRISVSITYPGASAQVVADTVAAPDRAAGQRRGGHAVHVVADGQRRLLHA